MLRAFIFIDSKSQWTKEEHGLLPHEICAILDEEKEMIYLWSKSKSTRKRYKKGYTQLKELISNFPELNLQFILAKKNFPTEIKKKLESMLESAKKEEESTLILSRFTTIRIFFIFLLGVIILPTASLFNLSISLFWPMSNLSHEVNSNIFKFWMNISRILMLLTIFLFLINLIIGITEMENQVIIFSFVSLIFCVGIFFYLNFDIFLFISQDGPILTNFLILKSDLLFFIAINTVSVLIFEIPNIYKLISFLKTYRKYIF
jgi:hypothetical protein